MKRDRPDDTSDKSAAKKRKQWKFESVHFIRDGDQGSQSVIKVKQPSPSYQEKRIGGGYFSTWRVEESSTSNATGSSSGTSLQMSPKENSGSNDMITGSNIHSPSSPLSTLTAFTPTLPTTIMTTREIPRLPDCPFRLNSVYEQMFTVLYGEEYERITSQQNRKSQKNANTRRQSVSIQELVETD